MQEIKSKYDNKKYSSLLCTDGDESLAFLADLFPDKDCILTFSIRDSYLGYTYGPNHLFSRLKRACKAFFNKPVYYAEIIPPNVDEIERWLDECKDIIKQLKDEGYNIYQ